MGGRGGDRKVEINQAAWLLAGCWFHHDAVTDAVGEALALARAMGWVLFEIQDALLVPVLTRHSDLPVLLDNRGGWTVAAGCGPDPGWPAAS